MEYFISGVFIFKSGKCENFISGSAFKKKIFKTELDLLQFFINNSHNIVPIEIIVSHINNALNSTSISVKI